MSDNIFNNESLLKGTVVIFIGNIIGSGSVFLTRIVAGRYLAVEEYGTLILGITVFSILSMVSLLGLPRGLAKKLPNTENRIIRVYSTFSFSFIISSMISISCIIFLYLFSSIDIFDKPGLVLVIFIISVPLNNGLRTFIGGFRGLGKARPRFILQNIIFQLGIFILVLITSVIGGGILILSLSWPLALAGGVILAVLMYNREFQTKSNTYSQILDKEWIYSLVLFSIPLMMSDSLWLFIEQADNILIKYFLGSRALGIYDAAFTLSRVLRQPLTALGFLILPMLSKYNDNRKYDEIENLYKSSAKWLAFLTFPIFLFIVSFPEQIIFITFGRKYITSSGVLIIISMGFFTHILLGVNERLLTAKGDVNQILYGNVIALIINITLNLLLIPILGIQGAAIASASTFAVINLYWTLLIYRKYGLHPISKGYFHTLVFTISTYMILIKATKYLYNFDFFVQFLLFIVFIISHFTFVLILGTNKKDRNFVYDLYQ